MTTKTIQSTGEALLAAPVTITGRAGTTGRLLYIDNTRTFLTVLVLLHHIMIVYAGSGSWIYVEGRQDLATTVAGSIFTAVNQAFFMGLFLLVPGSYDRKGPARFWKERLVRLGIPLAVYSWLVHPLFVYWFLRHTDGLRTPLWAFYGQYFRNGELIGGGPLWFVETLLIFTLIYAIWRLFARRQPAESSRRLPITQRLRGLHRAVAGDHHGSTAGPRSPLPPAAQIRPGSAGRCAAMLRHR
ncbi:MAG: acyltransferase [Anaerolineales bacterium]